MRRATQAHEVSGRGGVGESVIVHERTEFGVIHVLAFLRREHGDGEKQRCYQNA